MMQHKNKRFIIAGGGTGGHIFPGLAIAAALKAADPLVDILFVGARGKMEMQRVPEAGFKIKGIDIAGFNRSSVIKNFGLPFKLVKSHFQVRRIVRAFRPDGVIGVGGYSSFPVLRFAQSAGIPTFIHESNSLPGRTNKLLAKKAQIIFVASEGMETWFPSEKLIVSGNPIRPELLTRIAKADAMEFFGLKPGLPTVLVVGGSLGARSINEVIAKNIDFFSKNKVQLIWQTGKDFSGDAARHEVEFSNIWTNAFISRMDMAYSAADVVVARAGAITIAELKAQGKASILIPYPHAAEDHQTVNAKKLVDQQAALMIPDAAVASELPLALSSLITDAPRIEALEKNIARMARTDADKTIATEILKTIQEE